MTIWSQAIEVRAARGPTPPARVLRIADRALARACDLRSEHLVRILAAICIKGASTRFVLVYELQPGEASQEQFAVLRSRQFRFGTMDELNSLTTK